MYVSTLITQAGMYSTVQQNFTCIVHIV